jgi:hypothetical protein
MRVRCKTAWLSYNNNEGCKFFSLKLFGHTHRVLYLSVLWSYSIFRKKLFLIYVFILLSFLIQWRKLVIVPIVDAPCFASYCWELPASRVTGSQTFIASRSLEKIQSVLDAEILHKPKNTYFFQIFSLVQSLNCRILHKSINDSFR